MKLKIVSAAALIAAGAMSGTAAMADGHAACGEVSITEMDWASAAVVTAVSKFLMEQGYGCEVQVVPSSTVPALTSLAETGEPDILTEVWANSTPSYEPLLAEGKLELVGGKFHDCPSGWACDIINNNNLTALNIADTGLERFQHGSGETLQTSIAAAYDEQAPWFGYYWAPTAVLGKYPMVQVEVGEYNAEAHACNGDVDCADPTFSAYPAAKVVS